MANEFNRTDGLFTGRPEFSQMLNDVAEDRDREGQRQINNGIKNVPLTLLKI